MFFFSLLPTRHASRRGYRRCRALFLSPVPPCHGLPLIPDDELVGIQEQRTSELRLYVGESLGLKTLCM